MLVSNTIPCNYRSVVENKTAYSFPDCSQQLNAIHVKPVQITRILPLL
uniref:Uncharacterized protein n=1 Tax=Rhizophora mucronata TaxID=61149 RepID=A0A2P2MC69_RHIMU